MKRTEYPIQHFELMQIVASYLDSIDVQMLEQEYTFKTFGSWWFAFQIRGENFRIVWDGRDRVLGLAMDRGNKAPFGYEWTEVFEIGLNQQPDTAFHKQIQLLVEKAKAIRFQD